MTRSLPFAVAVSGLMLTVFAGADTDPALKSLVRRQLDAPAEIDGYPCAAGYTWYFADARLRECAVSRPIRFGAIDIPRGSWINLTHDGHTDFVFLAHDARLGGYTCKGGGPLGPTEGASTALYPGGQLKTCWLASDTVVSGVPCERAGVMGGIFGTATSTEFYEDGRLKSCKLSRGVTFGYRTLRRGDRIRFDADGKVAPQ